MNITYTIQLSLLKPLKLSSYCTSSKTHSWGSFCDIKSMKSLISFLLCLFLSGLRLEKGFPFRNVLNSSFLATFFSKLKTFSFNRAFSYKAVWSWPQMFGSGENWRENCCKGVSITSTFWKVGLFTRFRFTAFPPASQKSHIYPSIVNGSTQSMRPAKLTANFSLKLSAKK